ncbi:hypothetical protein IIB97_01270, partial [Patescibacteria group bacterium]|nr:hypothetical protein [Patescibacteria group bacterium]
MLLLRYVFGVVLAFGAGIFFASFFFSSYIFILLFLGIGIMFMSVFWKRGNMMHMGILFIVAALGMTHYFTAAKLLEFPLPSQDISFEGRIVGPPQKDEQTMKIIVQPAD